MHTYFQTPTINHAIELVAGPFASDVRLIWVGDRATDYLTASDARRHVWHTCLASEFGNFSPLREKADLMYSRFTTMRAKDLIVQAYGVRPLGIMGVLRRLGPKARSPEVYRALIVALENGGPGAQFLMRADEPLDSLIEAIAALPDDIGKHALAALVHPGINPEDLTLFIWTLGRLEKCSDVSVSALVNSGEPIKALLKALTSRPFPAAPWDGTPVLRPLQSADRLFTLADTFKNCVRRSQYGISEVLRVQNGTKYFYEWKGKEPALIDLVRLGGVGWFVHDIRGADNADIAHASRMEIAHAFRDVPNICATRLTVRANIYPCGHFWGEVMRGAE